METTEANRGVRYFESILALETILERPLVSRRCNDGNLTRESVVNGPLPDGPKTINFFTVKLLQLSGIALTTCTDVKVRVKIQQRWEESDRQSVRTNEIVFRYVSRKVISIFRESP